MTRLFVSLATSFIAAAALGGTASAQPYYDDGQSDYAAGRIQVYAGDGWYPAIIIEVSGNNYLVHYDGTDSDSDEWVDASRIQGLSAAYVPVVAYEPAVRIYWGNTWYDGTILGHRGGRYHVRYRGGDEWVSSARLHLHARGYANRGWGRVHAGGNFHGFHGGRGNGGFHGGRGDGGFHGGRGDGGFHGGRGGGDHGGRGGGGDHGGRGGGGDHGGRGGDHGGRGGHGGRGR
ncbi:MAG: agenet domain-containing protein [Myxococcota bacterium]